jgi:putative ABC transport system permease protein
MLSAIANIFESSLNQGLLLGIVCVGVVLAFRFLDFPDLTVDGSFVAGAAVSARLITIGWNPFVSALAAIPVGMLAGILTGFLHTKLKISKLLSGILTMTMLYSINLRILGRSNIPLIDQKTVFSNFSNQPIFFIPLLLCVVLCIIFLIRIFLKTEIGTAIRAVGNNEDMLSALGLPVHFTLITGLAVTNGIVAFGGAFYAQFQGYCDVTMGIGTILTALASIILGEAFITPTTTLKVLLAALLGSFFFQFFITLVLYIGLSPMDIKLATGMVIIIAVAFNIGNKDKSSYAVKTNY